MAITVDWENEQQQCILLTFHRPWEWSDFDAAYVQMDALFASVTHQSDLILDISDGGFPPPGALQNFKRVSENRHANLGKIVVVGVPFFFRGMLNILQSVYQGRYDAPDFLFAPTLEKAHEMLTQKQISEVK